ncbi:uncharacterized protein LOC111694245 [Trichogramma pretiosum]|uniref:uncharacterized protein LOC111694245 n=1 Tax=Trichogramma pretiosum TaxID=7493 RepID=UPI000C7195E0|nr:uncharacterized protein LOC111694245 [Trichogramma pretiosum]
MYSILSMSFRILQIKLLLIMCYLTKIQGEVDEDFIVDYFISKNVSDVTTFNCDNYTRNILLIKSLNENRIRAVIVDLNKPLDVRELVQTNYWRLGVVVDLRCIDNDQITLLFSEAANLQAYDELHHWLVLSPNYQTAMDIINDKNFGTSTDFAVAIPVIGGFKIFDLYNPWKEGGGKINVTSMGIWDGKTGLNINLIQSKLWRRSNFNGIPMKVSFLGSKYRKKTNMSLEVYLQDYNGLSKDGLSKFGFSILNCLGDMLNISFQFSEVQTWRKGDVIGPLSRSLSYNQIQLTGSPVMMTTERIGKIKFVYPSWPFRTCFIFRNPQPRDIKIQELLRPFAMETWYLTLILLLSSMTILAFSFLYETRKTSDALCSNSFIVVIGTFCQQGTNINMDKHATRIVYIHLLFFCFITYNYYSASIVSARLNEPIIKMNDSLNELSKTNLQMATEPMIYFDFLLKRLPPWEQQFFYKQRWLSVPEDKKFMYPEEAMPLVKKGELAYHTHPDVGYPVIDRTFNFREICELMEIKLLLTMCYVTKIQGDVDEEFIVDYFMSKNVSDVTSFNCDNTTNNILLMKSLNEKRIRAVIVNLNKPLDVKELVQTNYWRLGIVVDLRCIDNDQITLLFSEAANLQAYDELHHWLVISPNYETAMDFVNDESFGTSTDFVVAIPMIGGFNLFDLYNPWKEGGGKINVTNMGLWDEITGLNINLIQSKLWRRANFNGIPMKVSFFGVSS